MQVIDTTLFQRIVSMSWKDFINDDWIIFVVLIGAGISYWFWNSVFVLNHKED
jgi:hypothetical protein